MPLQLNELVNVTLLFFGATVGDCVGGSVSGSVGGMYSTTSPTFSLVEISAFFLFTLILLRRMYFYKRFFGNRGADFVMNLSSLCPASFALIVKLFINSSLLKRVIDKDYL